MGLRCLLGHDFGEPETERERNEEGNEVVVTVREVKTCRRCGEKQVVSENKEIKSIDQLRESATGEPASSDPAGGEFGTDGPAAGQEPASSGFGTEEPAVDDSASADPGDQWSAEELEIGESPSDPEPEPEQEPVADADDDVDRGVAEIIESAEKDDEMLQTDPESAEEAGADDAEDEMPVHPAERGSDEDESEDTAHEDEDAVILEDESPPEEGREQWDETARPEEMPGKDSSAAEPRSPDDDDAVIMDGEEPAADAEPEPEPTHEPQTDDQPSTEQPTSEASTTDQPTAVESEDAEIMGSTSDPDPEPSHASDATEATADSTAEEPSSEEPTRETTEEGHMPWPEAPGEDEGHDAEAPDGEPADVEFGGGITPEQPSNEQNGTDTSADSSEPSSQQSGSEGSASSHGGSPSSPEPNINLEQSSREAGLEYYCSECGLTRDVGNSSMRAGDICPECRKGYITERQKAE